MDIEKILMTSVETLSKLKHQLFRNLKHQSLLIQKLKLTIKSKLLNSEGKDHKHGPVVRQDRSLLGIIDLFKTILNF